MGNVIVIFDVPSCLHKYTSFTADCSVSLRKTGDYYHKGREPSPLIEINNVGSLAVIFKQVQWFPLNGSIDNGRCFHP